jgi:glutamate-1-semialdehyde aminotransferase
LWRDFVAIRGWLRATPRPATIVRTDYERMRRFHLAALNHGLFFAPRGLIAMSTVMTDAVIHEVLERAQAAFADVAAEPD